PQPIANTFFQDPTQARTRVTAAAERRIIPTDPHAQLLTVWVVGSGLYGDTTLLKGSKSEIRGMFRSRSASRPGSRATGLAPKCPGLLLCSLSRNVNSGKNTPAARIRAPPIPRVLLMARFSRPASGHTAELPPCACAAER